MIGDRVRELREARGWSQGHLSDVSGVSERTIQRVESQHRYSGETAMALAAALDVDIRRLTVPDPAAAGEHGPLWRAPPPPRAAILALVLTAPGALFITANTMAQRRLADAPLALLDEFGRTLGVVPAWWFLWPIPLIALPFAGILLVVASLLRVHGRHEGTAVTVTGIEIRWHPRAMLALFLAAATMVAPTANIAGEAIARAAQSLPR